MKNALINNIANEDRFSVLLKFDVLKNEFV